MFQEKRKFFSQKASQNFQRLKETRKLWVMALFGHEQMVAEAEHSKSWNR